MPTFLKGVGVFVGWLTGSLAGIGALLYAAGYLITRAQLRLLGLDGLLAQRYEDLVQEGAQFILDAGLLVADHILSILAALGLLFVVLMGLSIGLYLLGRLARLRPLAEQGKRKLADLSLKWSRLLPLAAYVVLVLVFLLRLGDYIPDFRGPLRITNLLYTDLSVVASGGSREREVREWLMRGDRRNLEGYFLRLFFGELEAGFFLFLAWRVTATWGPRLLASGPFLIVFLMYTVYLPIAYGILLRPMMYPVITLDVQNQLFVQQPTVLFLLDKTDQEFVVWDSRSKRVLWIAKGEVKLAEIKEVRNLFKKGDPR